MKQVIIITILFGICSVITVPVYAIEKGIKVEQLKEGQIIAEMTITADYPVVEYDAYRVFLKKVPEGFMVQEFYKNSHEKATDPFILQKEADLIQMPYVYFTATNSPLSITGEYIVWYKNGHKMQEGYYKQGKKDGFWVRWYSNGQKSAEGTFELGKAEGFWRVWKMDGTVMNETYYKDGRLEAVLSDVRANKKDIDGSLKNDTEKSVWLEWDEKGQLRSQVVLVNGKKEGVWVSWDDRGRREMLGYYRNDKRDGLWKTFWLEGKEVKRSEGLYKKGKKEGIWQFWNQEGVKIKQEYYQNGQLVKKINIM